MKTHPYRTQPDQAFWSRSVSGIAPSEVDPVGEFLLRLTAVDKVATAGSCFAQHIARHLQEAGLGYFVTERGEDLDPFDSPDFNYGTFTARYGNIYTSRQLLQLFKRAYGKFVPKDDLWSEGLHNFIDPFRPQIQPGGFLSERELRLDREVHLKAVRTAFETLDVLVFTLGLSELWISAADGAAYPVCPGVSGGTFDPDCYKFINLDASDVVEDVLEFFQLLRSVNSRARMILTVSPVPLAATATREHVLSATTYSKAVLRVAAETCIKQQEGIFYFPSYEIITGNFNRGHYYAQDLRSVTEAGVSHVMRLFLKYVYGIDDASHISNLKLNETVPQLSAAEEAVRVICEEEALALR